MLSLQHHLDLIMAASKGGLDSRDEDGEYFDLFADKAAKTNLHV